VRLGALLVLLAGCGAHWRPAGSVWLGTSDTGDTGESADSGDTGDTGDSDETGDSADTGDSTMGP
jgi:hypothetical protein